MKIYLISYSTKNYRLSHLLLNITARIFGADKCITYTEKKLKKTDFYSLHRDILNKKTGAGFWLWKYYFIYETIKKIDENDILIYCDAGTIIKKKLLPLINILTENDGALLFNQNTPNKFWIKRDCYIALECDHEEYYKAPQIVGNIQLFQKNKRSVQFVHSVLENSIKDNLITNFPNKYGKPDLDSFIEHRYDQAVTSLIAHKNKLRLFPDPTQFNNKNIIYQHPNEIIQEAILYKGIFYVHRLKNSQFYTLPFIIIRELFKRKNKKSHIKYEL